MPSVRVVQREGVRQECQRLGIGVVLERLLAGPAQVAKSLVGHARPAPVVGEQRVISRKILSITVLVPLRGASMELLPLPFLLFPFSNQKTSRFTPPELSLDSTVEP